MSYLSLTRRARSLFLALGLVIGAALAAVAARPAAAEVSPLRKCTNDAWGDYNGCLMESDSRLHRLGCDFYFEAEYVRCWAKWGQDVAAF